MFHAAGNNKVVRMIDPQYQPHGFHIIRGMPPVNLGIKRAKDQLLLPPPFDIDRGPDDLL